MSRFHSSPRTSADWAQISGDFNPLHLDPAFAAATPFGAPILHGSQTLALAVDHLLTARPRTPLAGCEVRFLAPAKVGAVLDFTLEDDPEAPGEAALSVTDETGTRVLEGRARFRLSPLPQPEGSCA